MTPERHREIGELFHAALEVDATERAAFLERACAGDATLRREVESLLASHEQASGFIASPALAVAAGLLANSETDTLLGRTIARYRVLSLVGAGGMGRVYLAEDTELGRRVTLKLLPEYFTHDKSQVQRFRQEARAASALNHPNIVTVHEVGQVDGTEFIVTEYVEGETLRDRLSHAPLGLREALDVTAQVADALAAAHEVGVVHRDIKPENIMLRRDGYVKVLDFGLAKLMENLAGFQSGAFEATTREIIRTNPGMIMGTAEYMSPEQARGVAVDARTDIWSLGVMLYEMIAGQRPFSAPTHSDTIVLILEREPAPLASYNLKIPAELQRIVTKALAKNTCDRFQTSKDMAIDLKRLRRRLEVEAEIEVERSTAPSGDSKAAREGFQAGVVSAREQGVPQTDRAAERTSSLEFAVTEIKRHKAGVALAAVLLIAALAGAAFGLFSIYRRWVAAKITSHNGQLQFQRLTSNGNTKLASVSPDGKFIAYVIEKEQQQSLWVKNIASGSELQILPSTAKVALGGLTFSPDGNHVYYLANTTLYRLPVLGGTPRKVIENVAGVDSAHSISFSPGEKQIVFIRRLPETNESAMIIADADGTTERTLALSKRPNIFLRSPAWSPDATVIACAAISASGNQEVAMVQVSDGAVSSTPSPPWSYIAQVAWLPDSRGLLVIAQGDGTKLVKIRYLSYPDGGTHIVSNDSNNYNSISLTTDGRSLVAVKLDQEAHIWAMPNSDTSQAKQLTAGFEKYDGTNGIDWLSDNKIIYQSAPDGRSEVWIVDADGSSLKQLSDSDSIFKASPDGRFYVTQSGDAEGIGLFRVGIDDGSRKRLTRGTDVFANFSADGKWLVYTRYADQVALWKVAIEGGEARKLSNVSGAVLFPAISPDSKLIAFYLQKSRQDAPVMSLIPFEGGEIIKTFDVPLRLADIYERATLQWTADSQAVYYHALTNGVSNIWRQPIDGSPPTQVTDFQTGRIFNFAYSPGGKQLALSKGTLERDVVLIKDFE